MSQKGAASPLLLHIPLWFNPRRQLSTTQLLAHSPQVASEVCTDEISLTASGFHKSPQQRFLEEESNTQTLSEVNAIGKLASSGSPEKLMPR